MKTQEFLGNPGCQERENGGGQGKDGGGREAGGIFRNVKKAQASRTKSQAPPEDLSRRARKVIPKSKSRSLGLSWGKE